MNNQVIANTQASLENLKVECNICKKALKDRYTLKKHIRFVHKGEKAFKCENCITRFTTKKDLSRHIAAVHERKRPFKCDICLNKS